MKITVKKLAAFMALVIVLGLSVITPARADWYYGGYHQPSYHAHYWHAGYYGRPYFYAASYYGPAYYGAPAVYAVPQPVVYAQHPFYAPAYPVGLNVGVNIR